MTDDELNRRFDAMMERLNDAQEAIIERVRACEASIAALTEVARAGNTTMILIANLMGDVARRVTDLEKKA
jgi:hypothetical protein